MCKTIATQLRAFKVQTPPLIPRTTEVAFLPPGNRGSPYPGLYLFTGNARLVRPVLQRASGHTEFIGPLEQGFMDIACLDEDIREGITTHQELDPTNMLSLIANMTPFSDQNQSPRNMYQVSTFSAHALIHHLFSRLCRRFATVSNGETDDGDPGAFFALQSRQQALSPDDSASSPCANSNAWRL